MSAFAELLVESKRLGITALDFEVNLNWIDPETMSADKGLVGPDDSWLCAGYAAVGLYRGYGRTGEEALRNVVVQRRESINATQEG